MCAWTKEFIEHPALGSFPTEELYRQLQFRFHNDTLRLANIMFLILCVFPKWMGSLLSGLIVAGGLLLSAKIARAARSATAVAVIALWWGFNLMGWNILLSADFLMNYFWSATLMLLCWWVFINDSSRYPIWQVAVLGLLTGMWHEGFAGPLLCGLLLSGMPSILKKRNPFDRRQWILMAALFAGFACLLCVPGMWRRVGTISKNDNSGFLLLAYGLKPLIPLVLLVAYSAIKKNLHWQKWSRDLLIVGGICAGCAAIAIVIGFGSFPWQFFPVVPATAIGVAIIGRQIFNASSKLRPLCVTFIWICLSIGLALAGFGIYSNIKVKYLYNTAVDHFAKNHKEAVFLPVEPPSTEFAIKGFVPSLETLFWDDWANECINYYVNSEEPDYRMRVVSDKLRHFTAPPCQLSIGNQNVHTINAQYIINYEGLLVLRLDNNKEWQAPFKTEVEVETSGGNKRGIKAAIVPFRSEKDGNFYGQVILQPSLNHLVPQIRPTITSFY